MKLSNLKISHILIVMLFLLWGWFFYGLEMVKYRMQFEQWRQQVTQAINQLDGRMKNLEDNEVRK